LPLIRRSQRVGQGAGCRDLRAGQPGRDALFSDSACAEPQSMRSDAGLLRGVGVAGVNFSAACWQHTPGATTRPRRVVKDIEPVVPASSGSFAAGLHRCAGRVDVYERILDRFLSSRLSEPADIQRAMKRADLKQASRIAHCSISTAGTIGASALSECARKLQIAIDAGDTARLPELVEAYACQHAVVASDIRLYFAGEASRRERLGDRHI
jgi:HPt (histidine-containing phosphotransfer) domain-containing protein